MFKAPYGTKGSIAERTSRQINDLIQSFGQSGVSGLSEGLSVKILSANSEYCYGRLISLSTAGSIDFMRTRIDDSSESFLGPDDPGPDTKHTVLLVIAGRMQGESLRYQLVCRGFEVDLARSVSLGLERAGRTSYDAVVLDWQTLEVEYLAASRTEAWLQLVSAARASGKAVGAVALIAADNFAVEDIERADAIAVLRGAVADPEVLAAAVERAIEQHVPEAAPQEEAVPPTGVIENYLFGGSEAIRDVFEQVRLVAGRDTTVLITGETGTGKERVSRAIHRLGARRQMEMVSINCGGIPATLLEDEFFGHVKGAFTDARQARIGRFEQANGSTIFLDEIGDLPFELQPKLLRVLQEREIHRIAAAAGAHGGYSSVQPVFSGEAVPARWPSTEAAKAIGGSGADQAPVAWQYPGARECGRNRGNPLTGPRRANRKRLPTSAAGAGAYGGLADASPCAQAGRRRGFQNAGKPLRAGSDPAHAGAD
jgi:hypothetical protein